MKSKKNSNFVMLSRDVIYTKPYIDLPASAAKAFLYFRDKVKLGNNAKSLHRTVFEFTYSEAKRYGFSGSTFANVIVQLLEHGFIDRVRVGNCFGEVRRTSQYRLSTRWANYGTANFQPSDQETLNKSIQRTEAGRW